MQESESPVERAQRGSTAGGAFGPRRPAFWLVVFAPLVLSLAATALPAFPGPRQLEQVALCAAGYAFIGVLLIAIGYPVMLLLSVVTAAIVGPPRRRGLLWVALSLLIGAALVFPSLSAGSRARMLLIRRATIRAEPLLHAVEGYREDHGAYPGALDELQPEYLAEVPGTGMIGYPNFDYEPPGEAAPEAGGYGLYVNCFVMSFDTLHYWPSQHYPEKMWGGVVERIDGWAYVHE